MTAATTFGRVNKKIYWIDQLPDLTSGLRETLKAITKFTRGGILCYAKVISIATKAHLSARSVQRHIQALEKKGYIEVVRRGNRTNLIKIKQFKTFVVGETEKTSTDPTDDLITPSEFTGPPPPTPEQSFELLPPDDQARVTLIKDCMGYKLPEILSWPPEQWIDTLKAIMGCPDDTPEEQAQLLAVINGNVPPPPTPEQIFELLPEEERNCVVALQSAIEYPLSHLLNMNHSLRLKLLEDYLNCPDNTFEERETLRCAINPKITRPDNGLLCPILTDEGDRLAYNIDFNSKDIPVFTSIKNHIYKEGEQNNEQRVQTTNDDAALLRATHHSSSPTVVERATAEQNPPGDNGAGTAPLVDAEMVAEVKAACAGQAGGGLFAAGMKAVKDVVLKKSRDEIQVKTLSPAKWAEVEAKFGCDPGLMGYHRE